MSKRKKSKKNRQQKTGGHPNTKHERPPHPRGIINMPGPWQILIGIALLLVAAGIGYFTRSPKILYIGAIGVCVLIFYATYRLVLHLETQEPNEPRIAYFGGLLPGNEPIPPLPPGVPPDTVQLLLGDDLRILSASLNPVFSLNGNPFLSISVRKGLMRLTATVLDAENQPICRITDNAFQAFQERAFNPKQPDEHSLIVRDSWGNEALNVRFLNPSTIKTTGRFQLPGLSEPILILPDRGIVWPGGGGIAHLTIDMTDSPLLGVIDFQTPN